MKKASCRMYLYSLGAIEKRKRKIRSVFGITDGGDKEILDKAKELGFL